MKSRLFHLTCSTLVAASVIAARPAAAQPTQADEVVVTATRLPTPLSEVASSITVITADDIRRNQFRTLPQALSAVPGLNVVQSGPTGTLTSLFVRGTESNHTVVLLDGMEINDPSEPEGAFNFGGVSLADVERIEILRGSQSTLYGSDAIGGVINIITKRGGGPPSASARLEFGTQKTLNQGASVQGAKGPVDFRLALDRVDTDGESITPLRGRPAGSTNEDDGFENFTATGKFGVEVSDALRFDLVARYVNDDIEIDANPEDPNSESANREFFGRVSARLSLFDGLFDNRFGIAYTDFARESIDPPDALVAFGTISSFAGSKVKLDWQGDIYLLDDSQIITLGAETEEDKANSFGTFVANVAADVRTNAAFAQLRSSFADRFFMTVGGRVDDHQTFGSETTWRVAPTYLHRETGTKLKGSYGTGFKAPAAQQLFGGSAFFFGNPALRPETSRAFDVGFDQALLDDRLSFGATYFEIEIKDLIAFVFDPPSGLFTLVNQDEGNLRGVEAYVAVRPMADLDLRADYTFTRAEDGADRDLLRRPKHKASLAATYRVRENATLTASLVYVGRRVDFGNFTFVRFVAPSYTVVNMAVNFDVNEKWHLFARANNVLDKKYEPADGFKALGVNLLFGVQATF